MLGTTLDGKYRILRPIGKGAMGSVYDAEHTRTGVRLALKVITAFELGAHDDLSSRFRREALAAGSIRSPHVVEIFDAGSDEATGSLYIAMERLRGEDLQSLLERVGPLEADVALRIAGQALIGLTKAHEAGTLHRDVKPANLFLARQRSGDVIVKLVDFGIAKILAPAGLDWTTSLTGTGDILGTPFYLSPEQIERPDDVDARADIWGLGCALYAMLAGRAPHQHMDNPLRLLQAICTVPAPPLGELAPWVPPPVADLVHGALAIDAGQRYPSATAMLARIRQHVPGDGALREDTLVGHSTRARVVIGPLAGGHVRGDETTQPTVAKAAASDRVDQGAAQLAPRRSMLDERSLAGGPSKGASRKRQSRRGERVAGRFQVIARLRQEHGRWLFAAEDLSTGRAVTILEVPRADGQRHLARWREDAEKLRSAAASARAGQLIEVVDDPTLSSDIVFVLAPLDGESLAERLDRVTAMPFTEVHPLFEDVWADLVRIHRADVVHGRLGPDVVFVTPGADGSERAQIRAFRLFPSLPEPDRDVNHAWWEPPRNTFAYTPPEQVGKARASDGAGDIYACAAMIFKSMSGQPLWPAHNVLQMVELMHGSEARRLGEALGKPVDPRLEAFLSRGLARRPEDRFPSAAAALEAWRALRDPAE